jgi:hypothetical protein
MNIKIKDVHLKQSPNYLFICTSFHRERNVTELFLAQDACGVCLKKSEHGNTKVG